MMSQPAAEFRESLIANIPHIRAFAMSLCRQPDQADDLVQGCVEKAWTYHGSFAPGTNLRAWLFTITRNLFLTDIRKSKREVTDSDGTIAGRVQVRGEQEGLLDLADLQEAIGKLSQTHREALVLVGAAGLSYEEAAEVCGVPLGTIKSRVSRGREHLVRLMGLGSVDDLEVDSVTQAATGQSDAPWSTR